MSKSMKVWCAVFLMTMTPLARASAQTMNLAWDQDSSSSALGYAVIIDGVRTDYGLSPLTGSVCGCSIPLPFSGGTHTIVVTAYNQSGEIESAPLVVAPSAVPGGPYAGLPGTAVTVDASGSSTPGGRILAYDWQWGDGTSDASASPTASHVFNALGTFDVTLTITDNAGATASAIVGVTITQEAAPTPADPPATHGRIMIGTP